MPMTFDDAFEILIDPEHEGSEYTDTPGDPGGPTKYGMTEKTARALGYTGDMKDIPKEFVKAGARKLYWDACGCDSLPECVRYEVFDTCYNSGPHEAEVILQRAVGVTPDGVMGRATTDAIAAMAPDRLRFRFLTEHLAFYAELSNFNLFAKGWCRRLVANARRP